VLLALCAAVLIAPAHLSAQDATTAREAIRARREARREANAQQNPDERNKALAERQRVESSLREALAQAVKQRLNLNDQQATRLMDVNRKFSEDRIRIARDEIRIRRELRQSMNGGDSARSPVTARLLDELLNAQRDRLELQQKEQNALSEFLTPEQRARYIAMMEQLRRRIQQRADSARGAGGPPEE
jgi:Spy/CpxP family protein refolding chaperone